MRKVNLPGEHLYHDQQLEGFRLRPWMGYVTAAVLMAAAWDRDGPEWIIVRGLGMTCFFTNGYVSERRRKEPGAGMSVGEMRSVVFAIFCGLLTLSFLIASLFDWWTEWVG